MNIIFNNKCRKTILISIQSGKSFRVKPYETVTVSYDDKHEVIFEVKSEIMSYKKRGKYILMIGTQYKFSNVNNNELFTISREKIRVTGRIFYDRLFIRSEKANCLTEFNNVLGAKEVREMFSKSQIRYYLIMSPIEHLTGLIIILAILGIFVINKTSMMTSVIYFISCYMLLLAIDWIIRKVSTSIFKRTFDYKDEKTEFLYYLENKTVDKYFLDPNRKPFMGEVEIN